MGKKRKQWVVQLMLCGLLVTGCGRAGNSDTTTSQVDTTQTPADSLGKSGQQVPSKVYQNEIFRDVTVQKIAEYTFLVAGEARVFEGQFNWLVEDGHYQLKKGTVTADRGTPNWGEFSFSVEVQKRDPHTTLHLILFDISPKDGEAGNELPVLLY